MFLGINRVFKKLRKPFNRDESGVAAVEFAMVGGPFLFMLLAIFDFGIMLVAEYAVEQNVANAARLIRTGQIQLKKNGHTDTIGHFKDQVCGNLGAWLDCKNRLYIDVRNFKDFDDINLPPAQKANGDPSDAISINAKYEPGAAERVVTVRVYYKWDMFVPGLPKLLDATSASGRSSHLLSAAATFRNEPFSDGS